jgi:hypothetical protein
MSTAAPILDPVIGATPNAQPVAPEAAIDTRTESKRPSRFGDRRVPVVEADLTTGATVSTVTR